MWSVSCRASSGQAGLICSGCGRSELHVDKSVITALSASIQVG